MPCSLHFIRSHATLRIKRRLEHGGFPRIQMRALGNKLSATAVHH